MTKNLKLNLYQITVSVCCSLYILYMKTCFIVIVTSRFSLSTEHRTKTKVAICNVETQLSNGQVSYKNLWSLWKPGWYGM